MKYISLITIHDLHLIVDHIRRGSILFFLYRKEKYVRISCGQLCLLTNTRLWREHMNGYTECFIVFTNIETLYALFVYTIAHTTVDTILYYNVVGIVALKRHYSSIVIALHFIRTLYTTVRAELSKQRHLCQIYFYLPLW